MGYELRDNSILHLRRFFIFSLSQSHLEFLERRTIHAASTSYGNVHARTSTLADICTQQRAQRVAHQQREFYLTFSQLWRAVFPADARNGESYSQTIKPFFLAAEASNGTKRDQRVEGRKVQKRMKDGRRRERERDARKEKARKRERDKRIVRRKDSEHGR